VQRRSKEALILVNETLNELIAESKAIWDREQDESMPFDEDSFLSRADPSILHFLIASGVHLRHYKLVKVPRLPAYLRTIICSCDTIMYNTAKLF
jgi:hypothetical protein